MITLQKTKHSAPPRVLIHGGEKVGKALHIATPIPIPTGWTTLEKLQVGDEVFDKEGSVVRVTNVTGIMENRDCYRVHFKDGSSLIADGDHQWEVVTLKGNSTRVLTTNELKGNLQPTKKDRYNYSIPVSEPIHLPKCDLPIDPYLLGVWLGDGTSVNGSLTIGDRDDSIMRDIIHLQPRNKQGNCKTYTVPGLKIALRKSNLLGNKHIPGVYFRASFEDRWALFQGLMDTDGYIANNGKGTCEFTVCDKKLAYGFANLLKTLGIKGRTIVSDAKLNGVVICDRYRVGFHSNINPFRVAFKANRFENRTSKRKNNKNAIVKIEKVISVPVKCIEVDSPSHTYLAGKSYLVTHNSSFASQAQGAIFLPTEEGLKGIDAMVAVGDGKQRLETWEEFDEALTFLEANLASFQTVILDSADWLENLIHDKVCRTYSKDNIGECAGGFNKGYLVALDYWSQVLIRLDRLNKLGKWVIVICHSKSVLFNDPLGEPYDLWTLKLHSPKGQNGSLELLKEWADVICFAQKETFISETQTTTALKDGEKKHRAVDTGKRICHYEPSKAFLAGNRYGIKQFSDLTWSAFMAKFAESQG